MLINRLRCNVGIRYVNTSSTLPCLLCSGIFFIVALIEKEATNGERCNNCRNLAGDIVAVVFDS